MATFVKLNNTNHVTNLTQGDDNWSSPEYIKITDYTGPAVIGGHYDSDTNTITPPLYLTNHSLGSVLENDPIPTTITQLNFPISFSFSENLSSTFLSSSLIVNNANISEFNISGDSLSLLVEPINPNQGGNFGADVTFPNTGLTDSSAQVEYFGWNFVGVVCDSSSFDSIIEE